MAGSSRVLCDGSGLVAAGSKRDRDTSGATCPEAFMESKVSAVSGVTEDSDVNTVGSENNYKSAN